MWGNMQSLSLEELMNMVRSLRGMQYGQQRPEWAQRPIGAPWGNVGYGNREGRPDWAGRPEGQVRPEFQRGYSPQGMGPRPEGQAGPPSWTPEVAQRGYNWAQSGQTGTPPWAQNQPVTPPVTPAKSPNASTFGRETARKKSEYL